MSSVRTHDTSKKWETTDEILWLSHIGQTSEHTQKIARAELLEGFLVGAKKRTDWLGLDRIKIISHAKKLLREARK